jgi:flagellar protein FliO/FliZ
MKRFSCRAFACALPFAAVAASARAGDAAVASAGNLLQVLLGLVVVLGCMAGAAWAVRRFGLAKSASAGAVKVIGGVSVGTRERVMVVEVADQWIVVGVAPGRVNALSTMPRQEGIALSEPAPVAKNFSAWLKQTIEKRNGQ